MVADQKQEEQTRLIDEIEREYCLCGAKLDRNKPRTWEHCGIHKRCQKLREYLVAALEDRQQELHKIRAFLADETPDGDRMARILLDAILEDRQEATKFEETDMKEIVICDDCHWSHVVGDFHDCAARKGLREIHQHFEALGFPRKWGSEITPKSGGVPSEATPSKEDSGPIWRKCDQCGRENSLETWAKYLGKCPSCHNLHDRDSPHPENRECNTCGGTIAPGPDGKWWHLKAGDALKCRTGLVSPKPSAPAPEVQGTPKMETNMVTCEQCKKTFNFGALYDDTCPHCGWSPEDKEDEPVGTQQKETPPMKITCKDHDVLDCATCYPTSVSFRACPTCGCEKYHGPGINCVPEGVQGKEPPFDEFWKVEKEALLARVVCRCSAGSTCDSSAVHVDKFAKEVFVSGEAAGRRSAITEMKELLAGAHTDIKYLQDQYLSSWTYIGTPSSVLVTQDRVKARLAKCAELQEKK